MAFSEDLSPFFADFGVTATVGGNSFLVIHDRAFLRTLTDLVEDTGPVCVAKTTDVSALAEGDAITIAGTNYVVVDPQPDGTGITRLSLRLA